MPQATPTDRTCPVCQEHNKSLLFRQEFAEISDVSFLSGYDVVVCRNCGFCFADQLPDQAAFDSYYREMSKYEHQDRAGQPSEFETRQFPALAEFIRQQLPDPQARILEIGCANGGLLYALQQAGYQRVMGVDPSPVCARNAEQLYGIHVVTAALSDLRPELGPFDCLILVAVLEHVRNLEGALAQLSGLLAPGGKLYIEVPDATRFALSPDAPFQEFSIEHINFFSSKSLTNLMGLSGFSVAFSGQTSYEQTDTHVGHAIRMVFQKDNGSRQYVLSPDLITMPALNSYIAASREVEDRIHTTVNELADNQRPLIVWGVGTHTQRLLATSRLTNANIVLYVDSNPNYQGKLLNSIPIVSPQHLVGRSEPILVSSRIFQGEIVHQIRSELKLQNEIYTLYQS